ncbi:flocculation protein FLO11-like [Sceloporus undulatus]|uniref:flocculation protein FLO11-like n=1 Tax=Sceloporus undulatus TaxID=8520 RepID=UPI001C4BB9F6|nr:flocculation protein FLO11-like [Sceloporus undulatus]
MSPPFKKCDIYGGKVPVQDPHTSCLFCLGKDHDVKSCSLCKSMSSQARKNRESRLTSAIAQGKIREGDPRPSSAPVVPVSAALSARDGPASAPPSTSDRSGGPNPDANVARGSDKPSATTKPTKHPHKSGSVGTAAASSSSRKRDTPAKTLRPASEHRSRKEAPSDPKDGSGTVRDSSSKAKAAPRKEDAPRPGGRLTESPIPFFPPDAPQGSASSKKRKASDSTSEATASKKAKHAKEHPRKEPEVAKDVDRPVRPRIRPDSPRRDTLTVASEAQQTSSTPGPSATTTVPFLLSNEEDSRDRLSRSPSRGLPSRSPSPALRSPARSERPPRSPSPAPLSPLTVPADDGLFYDSEADQFYLKVSRDVAMSRVHSGDHPRDRPREVSQPEKRHRDPVPASRAALLRLRRVYGLPSSRPLSGPVSRSARRSLAQETQSQGHTGRLGTHGLHDIRHPMGTTAPQASSGMVPLRFQPIDRLTKQVAHYTEGRDFLPPMVARLPKRVHRYALRPASTTNDSDDGCVDGRLGCTPSGPMRKREVVPAGTCAPHQRAGNVGGREGSESIRIHRFRQGDSTQDRQHNCDVLCQQTGRHQSRTLLDITLRIWDWCIHRRILLQAIHLPGEENTLADQLSRTSTCHEWRLHPETVDLFATASNSHCPQFCSRVRHESPFEDAFAFDWSRETIYAFPPFPLLTRVVSKMSRERVNAILITPWWPRQPWFPLLLHLSNGEFLRLEPRPDLLTLLGGRVRHPDIDSLPMVAWRLLH